MDDNATAKTGDESTILSTDAMDAVEFPCFVDGLESEIEYIKTRHTKCKTGEYARFMGELLESAVHLSIPEHRCMMDYAYINGKGGTVIDTPNKTFTLSYRISLRDIKENIAEGDRPEDIHRDFILLVHKMTLQELHASPIGKPEFPDGEKRPKFEADDNFYLLFSCAASEKRNVILPAASLLSSKYWGKADDNGLGYMAASIIPTFTCVLDGVASEAKMSMADIYNDLQSQLHNHNMEFCRLALQYTLKQIFLWPVPNKMSDCNLLGVMTSQ